MINTDMGDDMNTFAARLASIVVPVLLTGACGGESGQSAGSDEIGEPVVAFGNDECTYAGSRTFRVGDEISISIVNDTDSTIGFSLSRLLDDKTIDDLDGLETPPRPDFVGDVLDLRPTFEPTYEVPVNPLSGEFSEAGYYAVTCHNGELGGLNISVPAAGLTVEP